MKRLSHDTGLIHFTGIGGAGMSGIAEIMHGMGYAVQGSDLASGAAVERLAGMGIKIFPDHNPENLEGVRLVVFSSAIRGDNPELAFARAHNIPLVRRADMLGELMRFKTGIAVAGSHGKTTTTSLLAAIFEAADFKPTVINGGLINAYGASARLGEGEWMIAEADESDGTFVRLPATLAVITNIDREHMDYYHSPAALEESFRMFVEHLPFYGFAAICHDRPELRTLMGRIEDRRIFTYGTSKACDVQGINPVHDEEGNINFELIDRIGGIQKKRGRVHLAMPGRHNMLNALGAIVIALAVEIPFEVIARALQSFAGVKRRFTKTGEVGGVKIYDDYAHHPAEIAAVLETARTLCGEKGSLIAVVQPHRYSRLKDLFAEFCRVLAAADKIILAPVYAAGEEKIPAGPGQTSLRDALIEAGHKQIFTIEKGEELPALIHKIAREGDNVFCMGAGSITHWANELPQALAQFREVRAS